MRVGVSTLMTQSSLPRMNISEIILFQTSRGRYYDLLAEITRKKNILHNLIKRDWVTYFFHYLRMPNILGYL